MIEAEQAALAAKKAANDREPIRVVTIDHENSPDLDDGFWVTETSHGFTVDVAIIDVSVLLERRHTLQHEVFSRSFSRYFHTSRRADEYMLPPELAKGAASLIPGANRPAVVTRMRFDENGALQTKPERSLRAAVNQERLAPINVARRSRRHDEVGQMLLSAKRLSRLMEVSRRYNYQQPPANADRQVSPNDARRIVHEFMTATNVVNALLSANAGIPVLYRNLNRVVAGDAQELGQPEYSVKPSGHEALHLPAYMHFTSPARRAADAISQMNIVAHMTGKRLPFSFEHMEEWARRLNHAERTFRPEPELSRKRVLNASVVKKVAFETPDAPPEPKQPKRNYKTELLDLYQATGAPHPEFEVFTHGSEFQARLRLQLTTRTRTFMGLGLNKKSAEQAAAETALRKSRAELHQLAHQALTDSTIPLLTHAEALEQLCAAIGIEPVFTEQDTTGAHHFTVEFEHDDRFQHFEGTGDSPDAARNDAAARAFTRVARREFLKENLGPLPDKPSDGLGL